MDFTIPKKIKAIIIGDKNVGKTTIADEFNRFDKFEEFNVHFSYNSGRSHLNSFNQTFVADTFKKNIPLNLLLDILPKNKRKQLPQTNIEESIDLTLWDTAGFEKYDTLPPRLILNGSNVVIICFTCDDMDSFKKAVILLDYCRERIDSKDCVFFVMATKTDTQKTKYDEITKRSYSIISKENFHGPFINTNFEKTKGGHDDSTTDDFVLEQSSIYAEMKKSLVNLNNEDDFGTNDFLFSYTSIFCRTKSKNNPVFCLLYSIAFYVHKKMKRQVCSDDNESYPIEGIGSFERRRRDNVKEKQFNHMNNVSTNTVLLEERFDKQNDCCL